MGGSVGKVFLAAGYGWCKLSSLARFWFVGIFRDEIKMSWELTWMSRGANDWFQNNYLKHGLELVLKNYVGYAIL